MLGLSLDYDSMRQINSNSARPELRPRSTDFGWRKNKLAQQGEKGEEGGGEIGKEEKISSSFVGRRRKSATN